MASAYVPLCHNVMLRGSPAIRFFRREQGNIFRMNCHEKCKDIWSCTENGSYELKYVTMHMSYFVIRLTPF